MLLSLMILLSKYCVNGRMPWPWFLYIIYRLYKDAIHGKKIKENKFPHDSSPIQVNYNLSNNVCKLYKIINGEIRKQLWDKIRKEMWIAKLSFDSPPQIDVGWSTSINFLLSKQCRWRGRALVKISAICKSVEI